MYNDKDEYEESIPDEYEYKESIAESDEPETEKVLVLTLDKSFFENCRIIQYYFDDFRKVFTELDNLSNYLKIYCNFYSNLITNINRNDLQIFYDVINKIIIGYGKNLDDLINLNDFYGPKKFNDYYYLTQLIVDNSFTINENLIDMKKNRVLNKNIYLETNIDYLNINREFIENNKYLNEFVEKNILDINSIINALGNFYWNIYKHNYIPENISMSKQFNLKKYKEHCEYGEEIISVSTRISYDLEKISLNLIKITMELINNNCDTISELKMYNKMLNNAIIEGSYEKTINNLLDFPKFGILYNSAKDDFNSYL
jgi:hypothetical protein